MINGIHHITAMCSDPQRNVDFYSKQLGLRLVKVNVNMDDPGTYHFYFGDRVGSPGSALTFFPWPDYAKGVVGSGQVAATAFSVPRGSLEFWKHRLPEADRFERFGDLGIAFRDPDGLPFELIESDDSREPWSGGEILSDQAVRGFHSATLWSRNPEATAKLLTGLMDFHETGAEVGRTRFSAGDGKPHQIIDIGDASRRPIGRTGAGSNHHIAFRVKDDVAQAEAVEKLRSAGLGVTEVQERFYFRSVYFREPGHILFEIATDLPGFTADEPVERLGERLCLPPWFEARRNDIERVLPRFTTPTGVVIP